MNKWQHALHECSIRNTPCVLATIVETSGSTPRASGKMVITAEHAYDTIGGGQLELLVIEKARRMLEVGTETNADAQQLEKYPLAAAAMQCCGGAVTVLYESFNLSRLNVTLFGAGHVGTNICRLLRELDAFTTVVDARSELLSDIEADRIVTGEAASACDDVPPGEIVLVMTHDHLIDYQVVSALLKREDLAMLGLIGSTTKWQNFRRRLERDGFSAAELERVTCPSGLADVPGKLPMAVAISVVAQLLKEFDPERAGRQTVVGASHDAE